MVFVGGPRQVGKTTLAKSLIKNKNSYLNWDYDEHRSLILERKLPRTDFLIFDELHKYKDWRRFIKGLYDIRKDDLKILVTGSARLDYYRFGGDSLQGRYHYLRFAPLSVKELGLTNTDDLQQLLTLGGFPEPYFSGSQQAAQRWAREYRSRIVRDEINSLEKLNDLTKIELLLSRLPKIIGNPLSINNIANDLLISHPTAANWLEILERMYACFRVPPFGADRIKAIKKEQKLYLYDWSQVEEPGYQFENMVAVHLLKWVHYQQDIFGADYELRYFRDIEKREVDFVICKKNVPTLFVECKLSSSEISDHLCYLQKKFPKVRSVQVALMPKKTFKNELGIELLGALEFLTELI